MADYEYPLSREAALILDLLDVLLARWMPKGQFKPSPRPSDAAEKKRQAARLNDPALYAKLRPSK